MKIAIIAFYFWKLPNYFNLWLLSAWYNRAIDFYFFTDNTDYYNYPDNVHKIQTIFLNMKEQLQKCIDVEIHWNTIINFVSIIQHLDLPLKTI